MAGIWRYGTASEPDEGKVWRYLYWYLMLILLALQIVHLTMGFVGIHYDENNQSDSSIALNNFFVSAHVISAVFNVWMATGHFRWTVGDWDENFVTKIWVFIWMLFSVNSLIGIFLSIFIDPKLEFHLIFAIIQLFNLLYSLPFLGYFGYFKLEPNHRVSAPVISRRVDPEQNIQDV
jgi:hypothetical protein